MTTALAYTGQYDPRVYPVDPNASAYASVNETTTPSAGWPQWREIPYYEGNPAGSASGSKMTTIARIYLSNDVNYLYVRVDNASGSLSAYNTSPLFGAFVYAQDFDHSSTLATTSAGFYGGSLDHPMNYMVGRWSNSANFSSFSAGPSGWNFTQNLTGLAPQWDTSTGRVEMKIPLSSLASGTTAAGDWSYLDIELAYQNPATGTWSDDDITGIHYELAGAGQAWLYGSTLGHELLNTTTSAARYAPGAQVPVEVQVLNPQTVTESGQTLHLTFTHLGTQVGSTATVNVPSLAPGQVTTEVYDWTPPSTDHQGYLVQATLDDSGGNQLDSSQTAVDVSSDYAKFPRYGFVTNFGDNYLSGLTAAELNDFHINAVQFYDWEWKHHVPLAGTTSDPASSWVDIGNDTNYEHTVKDLISAVHNDTMAAFNYNLIYGAWAGYGQDGSGVNSQWGLWWNSNCTNQVNLSLSGLATSNIYVFDPGNSGWQSYIFSREKDAFSVYPFDGWQADQLGSEGTTYTCGGAQVDPATEFNGFLTNAYTSLGKAIVFNAVGQYGQQQIAANPDLSFLYTEAWPANGQTTYNDLRTTVDDNDSWSNNTKSTVIAAYLDQAYSQNYSDTSPSFFSDPGVLLADAAIFASGGDHIEFGDIDHLLDQPDYTNEHLLMDSSLMTQLRHYYDFLVAYENLLRDGETPSSNQIMLSGEPESSTGTAGTIWDFASSKSGTDVLNFINLLNNSSSDWMDTNASYPAPTVQSNVQVKYYYTSSTAPASVQVASPDVNGGAAQNLPFTTGSDSGGNYVTFTLPPLDYWDLAWVTY